MSLVHRQRWPFQEFGPASGKLARHFSRRDKEEKEKA